MRVPCIPKTYSSSSKANLQSRSREATAISSRAPSRDRSRIARRPFLFQLMPLATSVTISCSGSASRSASV